ncbi:ABC transporter substrate-binding protein [bacterium]|nr:ABC transporter substrate-binding protein [candidate division CSSED10-310 bacterium]
MNQRAFFRTGLSLVVVLMSLIAVQAEVGVTDMEIVIGTSLALDGHASYLGTQTLHGAMTYINHINDAGGVNGRKIRVISYDDAYEPAKCTENTNKLIDNDNVFALFCYVGTPTSVEILPIIKAKKVPLVGLFTGAEVLREPVIREVFNIRTSYYEETGGIVKHFWEDMGVRKIAVLYQNDAYGEAGLKGVELALSKFNSKPVAIATYERGSNAISEAMTTLRASDPEAVIIIGVYGPTSTFIRSAKWSGFNPYFHTVSFVGADQLAELLGVGRDSNGTIVTQCVPPPTSDVPGAVEYRNLLKKYYPDDTPNFVSFEGFINAKVLVSMLEKTGPALTRDAFIAAGESINVLDVGLGSAKITYGPDDHRGLDQVYYTVIIDGKYEIISDFKTIKKY